MLNLATQTLHEALTRLAFATSVAASATAQVPDNGTFTIECDQLKTSQVLSNIGKQRFRQTETSRVQRYTVSPTDRTITIAFRYVSEEEPWVENPRTIRNVTITRAGRIMFCETTENYVCGTDFKKTQNLSGGHTRTVTTNSTQTILFPSRGTMTRWNYFHVSASDGSTYVETSMTEGKCRVSSN